ncbi:MAG: transporter, partial [Gammaproteobacteria bacterium]
MQVRLPLPALAAGILGLSAAAPAQACSTCKCGDYSITLLGVEKPYAGRLRGSFDTLVRSETQGAGL